MLSPLQVGAPVPVFSAIDQHKQPISPKTLLGKPYLLYFYPKDDTPGCTTQACALRDAKPEFDRLQLAIIGVSPDGCDSHDRFIAKYGLNFSLIADEEHRICDSFNAWGERLIFGQKRMGVIRTSVIVNSRGVICWIEQPVQVEGHVERILDAVRTLKIS